MQSLCWKQRAKQNQRVREFRDDTEACTGLLKETHNKGRRKHQLDPEPVPNPYLATPHEPNYTLQLAANIEGTSSHILHLISQLLPFFPLFSSDIVIFSSPCRLPRIPRHTTSSHHHHTYAAIYHPLSYDTYPRAYATENSTHAMPCHAMPTAATPQLIDNIRLLPQSVVSTT